MLTPPTASQSNTTISTNNATVTLSHSIENCDGSRELESLDEQEKQELVKKSVRVASRTIDKEIKRLLGVSGPGQHSPWSGQELMYALLDARGKLQAGGLPMTYESVCEILKQVHPRKAPPTGNALRLLLRRFQISWKQFKSVQY